MGHKNKNHLTNYKKMETLLIVLATTLIAYKIGHIYGQYKGFGRGYEMRDSQMRD